MRDCDAELDLEGENVKIPQNGGGGVLCWTNPLPQELEILMEDLGSLGMTSPEYPPQIGTSHGDLLTSDMTSPEYPPSKLEFLMEDFVW